LLGVQINDRICLRYIDKKGGKIHIAAIGTVSDIANVNDGKLGVMWDYKPPEYQGLKPSGTGSGNWWKTLFQLKRHSDIAAIFNETLIERRVSRLAWNDYGWVMPSGPFDKSKDPESHEAKHGYGHEEWIFDTGKLINGFHCGFLESVRKEQHAYSGKMYNVWLYAINGTTKKRFWIGEINNLMVLNRAEADVIYKTYAENGWIKEMEEQIRLSGANAKGFSNWKGVDVFNVKFKPGDIMVNDPYYELPEGHTIFEQSRYAFAHFRDEYEITNESEVDDFEFTSSPDNEEGDKGPKSKTYVRKPKAVEITYLHRAISDSLTKLLRQTYGKANVSKEHSAGYGANRIDIVVRDKGILTFYEIKTYNSVKTSIREAFGQLLEYSFFPDKQKAKELIIVTQIPADNHITTYFKHLRNIFKLPIFYQSFDLITRTLSEKC
jgi:hypothetical protein